MDNYNTLLGSYQGLVKHYKTVDVDRPMKTHYWNTLVYGHLYSRHVVGVQLSGCVFKNFICNEHSDWSTYIM